MPQPRHYFPVNLYKMLYGPRGVADERPFPRPWARLVGLMFAVLMGALVYSFGLRAPDPSPPAVMRHGAAVRETPFMHDANLATCAVIGLTGLAVACWPVRRRRVLDETPDATATRRE